MNRFPIYTKSVTDSWYSKIISENQSLCVEFNNKDSACIRSVVLDEDVTTVEYDWMRSGADVPSTEAEFKKAYRRAMKQINQKFKLQ